jgi:hypothetical protein
VARIGSRDARKLVGSQFDLRELLSGARSKGPKKFRAMRKIE